MMLLEQAPLRNDFPMLCKKMHGKPLIYFDNGATTFKPKCVIDAISNFYSNQYATVHRAIYELSEHSDKLYHDGRCEVLKFINASSEKEVIFTSGTTDGINTIAQSYAKTFLNENDEIILSEIEHHSNLVPWQMIAKTYGLKLRFASLTGSGELDLNHFKTLLNERTKLISFAHVSNVTGAINPIQEIVKQVRENSTAHILVDGAQAAAHIPIDVQALDVDFYVFSGHKVLGPTGIGVLYGKEAILEKMEPVYGGGDMIDQVSLKQSSYNKLPLKFEAGTPNIAGVIGLSEALKYLQKIKMVVIENKEKQLLEKLKSNLCEIGNLKLIGNPQKQSAIVSFVVEGIHPLDLATLLNLKGVALRSGHLCAQTALRHFAQKSFLRASLCFYNTFAEIDLFTQYLKESIAKLS